MSTQIMVAPIMQSSSCSWLCRPPSTNCVSINRQTLQIMAKTPAIAIEMKLLLRKKMLMRLIDSTIHITLLKTPFPTNLQDEKSSLVVMAQQVSPTVADRVAEAARSTLEAVYIEQMYETRQDQQRVKIPITTQLVGTDLLIFPQTEQDMGVHSETREISEMIKVVQKAQLFCIWKRAKALEEKLRQTMAMVTVS